MRLPHKCGVRPDKVFNEFPDSLISFAPTLPDDPASCCNGFVTIHFHCPAACQNRRKQLCCYAAIWHKPKAVWCRSYTTDENNERKAEADFPIARGRQRGEQSGCARPAREDRSPPIRTRLAQCKTRCQSSRRGYDANRNTSLKAKQKNETRSRLEHLSGATTYHRDEHSESQIRNPSVVVFILRPNATAGRCSKLIYFFFTFRRNSG